MDQRQAEEVVRQMHQREAEMAGQMQHMQQELAAAREGMAREMVAMREGFARELALGVAAAQPPAERQQERRRPLLEEYVRLPTFRGGEGQYTTWRNLVLLRTRGYDMDTRVASIVSALEGQAAQSMTAHHLAGPVRVPNDEEALAQMLDAVFAKNWETELEQDERFRKMVIFQGDVERFINTFEQEVCKCAGQLLAASAVKYFLGGLLRGGASNGAMVVKTIERENPQNVAALFRRLRELAPVLSAPSSRHASGPSQAPAMSPAVPMEGVARVYGAPSRGGFRPQRSGKPRFGNASGSGERVESRECFNCGRIGHIARACTAPKVQRGGRGGPRGRQRIFDVEGDMVDEGEMEGAYAKSLNDHSYLCDSDSVFVSIHSPHTKTGTFTGTITQPHSTGRPNPITTVSVLIDSGASSSMVSVKLAERLQTTQANNGRPTTFKFANGTYYESSKVCHNLQLKIQAYKTTMSMLVCKLEGVDVILGRDWLKAENPQIDWATGTVTLDRESTVEEVAAASTHQEEPRKMAQQTLTVVSNKQMRRLLKKRGQLEYISIVIPKAMEGTPTLSTKVPNELEGILKKHAQLFEEPTMLPPQRPNFDHRIVLEPDSKPAYRNYVRLGVEETDELAKQLEALLEKGYIQASASPYGAPALFVKKKDGGLRMCLDYRGLNNITTKDKYPLPNISDILDRVATAKVFSKMDLRAGYHQVRMASEDIYKTAFVTHMGAYEWKVLPMGLTNAPATFQRLMNSTLAPHRGNCVVYLDDILVFSNNIEEHKLHLSAVLESLQQAKLKVHAGKSEFGKSEVSFLGHVVGHGMLGMELGKIEAVRDWKLPTTKKQLQSFLGFANFYRTHVERFSHIAAPLTNLLEKADVRGGIVCGEKETTAFQQLKSALITAPLLHGIVPAAHKVLFVDASDEAVGAVLHQINTMGEQVPVAFGSRKLTKVERRYPTRDKELLALMFALRQWRHHLLGRNFTVYSDHESLRYLLTMDISGRKDRLARWSEELASYDFDLKHVKGTLNIADALSRLEHPTPAEPISTTSVSAVTSKAAMTPHEVQGTSIGDMAKDAFFGPIVRALEGRGSASATVEHRTQRFRLQEGHLYLVGMDSNNMDTLRCCVAGAKQQSLLLKEYHDSESAGHPGVDRTLVALSRHFFWPRMHSAIKRYVRECASCQQTKGRTTAMPPQPIPVPPGPGHTLSLDFMELPLSTSARNSVLVIVDKFSKLVKIVPTTVNATAEETADIVFSVALTTFGRLPAALISDRDARFTSELWQQVWKSYSTRLHLTTAHRPQADGQTERANRQVLEHLRHYCNQEGADWDKPRRLAQVEFALNAHASETTGTSAFELLTGRAAIAPIATGVQHVEKAAGTSITPAMHEARTRLARDNMEAAGDRMVAANGDGNTIKERFKIDDKVLLHTRNYPNRRAHKLQPPYIGPFRVIEVLSQRTVRLQLPDHYRIHPVINVDQLKRFQELAVPTEGGVEGDSLTIEKIVDAKVVRGKRQYLVRWMRGKSHTGVEDDYWLAEEALQQQCPAGDFAILLRKYQASRGHGGRRSERLQRTTVDVIR